MGVAKIPSPVPRNFTAVKVYFKLPLIRLERMFKVEVDNVLVRRMETK